MRSGTNKAGAHDDDASTREHVRLKRNPRLANAICAASNAHNSTCRRMYFCGNQVRVLLFNVDGKVWSDLRRILEDHRTYFATSSESSIGCYSKTESTGT